MTPPPAPRLVAGVDVGNATTEVVLAVVEDSGGTLEVVAHGRVPTRRTKGSPESLHAAAALVRRLELRHGVRVTEAAVAPLRPVVTSTATIPGLRPDTGRLTIVAAGVGTAGGAGVGVGPPYVLSADHSRAAVDTDAEPVVVLVPGGTGFRETVRLLEPLVRAGRVAAVCLADDEGVLVSNRLPGTVPVVDEVDVTTAAGAQRVLVEVADPGQPLRMLVDPWLVTDRLRLEPAETGHAAALSPALSGVSNAVVAATGPDGPRPDAAPPPPRAWGGLTSGAVLDLDEVLRQLAGRPVGWIRSYAVPPLLRTEEVDDLWGTDLAAVVDAVHGRRAALGDRAVGLAALRSAGASVDPAGLLTGLLDVPVSTATSEGTAARAGALSTPGSSPDALVVDLGAGTADVVAAGSEVVAAGGGQLLTVAVAAVTGTTAAAAEYVKRGPAFRVEAPQVLLAEDGTRSFLDQPVGAQAVGTLAVHGPAGLLPFHRLLAPSEWRGLRLRLKSDVLGRNVTRAMSTLAEHGRPVVLVGGPAEDDEVLTAVSAAMPTGAVVARGDVAGTLGPRYAVAFGLALLSARAGRPA